MILAAYYQPRAQAILIAHSARLAWYCCQDTHSVQQTNESTWAIFCCQVRCPKCQAWVVFFHWPYLPSKYGKDSKITCHYVVSVFEFLINLSSFYFSEVSFSCLLHYFQELYLFLEERSKERQVYAVWDGLNTTLSKYQLENNSLSFALLCFLADFGGILNVLYKICISNLDLIFFYNLFKLILVPVNFFSCFGYFF